LVVCHCERVSERRVVKAVRSGCASLRAVCQETGAGQACGGCVSTLKKVLEHHTSHCNRTESPNEAA
jgi:bacterioferritin-associated ferredoxin